MDLLIADSLETDVVEWLALRHSVRVAPELAAEPRELRRALYNVQTAIVAPQVAIGAEMLDFAPVLRAIGRVGGGPENIDAVACGRRRIEIVRSANATGRAEAEFVVGAALTLLRRMPLRGIDGAPCGREIGGATVGLVGMTSAARAVAQLLSGFGVRLLGYDPALHASDSVWPMWQVEPVGLRELVERADVLFVLLPYASRYHGLLGDRLLPHARPGQVIVCTSHAGLFDEQALAAALKSGRVAAACLDSAEPGTVEPGRPLAAIDTLQVTPRLAGATRESRQRAGWAVARRLDELLDGWSPDKPAEFVTTVPGALVDLEAGPASR